MTDSAAFWANYPNLDYLPVLEERRERLKWIRAHPQKVPELREYYRTHPADFINEWGWTTDTREIAKGKGALVPFVLWPKQRELLEWMYGRWRRGEPGTVVKSRDVGASYCAMALLSALAVLERDFAGGVVSATEVKLDRVGDPDTLLAKARLFLKNLPAQFAGGYVEEKHSSHLRIIIPGTGGTLVGETGDAAGRGSRKAIVIADESSHYPHPKVADAALVATTPCRIDLSSVNGTANSFYERAHNPDIPRFDFTWRDDPRRDEAWAAQMRSITAPVIWAAEYDCDFSASTEGQLIAAAHISSAIGARAKLGLPPPCGAKCASYDPADSGADKNALAIRHGSSLVHLESWSGKGKDLHKSTAHVFAVCDRFGVRTLHVDVDGVGAGVKGAGAALNEQRLEAGRAEIEVLSYRGSGAVFDPDGALLEGVKNRDAFVNQKAMTGFASAGRFEYTHRVVEAYLRDEPIEFDPDDLIDIDPNLPELNPLISELSQPVYGFTAAGKRQIDKQPDGIASPNLYDAVAMVFSPFAVGGYFGTRSSAAVAVPASRQIPTAGFDRVFAVVSFVGDAAAVVYIAANYLDPTTGQPRVPGRGCDSWILDWDLRELGFAADAWIGEIDARADELQRAVMRITFRAADILCDDFVEGWAAVLRQRGFQAKPVGKNLPPIGERFAQAKPYFRIGGLIKHADAAERRVVSFRGSSARNHLRELASSTEPTQSNPLAIAYATAILTVYWGRRVVPQPLGGVEVLQPPAPPGPWRGFRV